MLLTSVASTSHKPLALLQRKLHLGPSTSLGKYATEHSRARRGSGGLHAEDPGAFTRLLAESNLTDTDD